MTFNWQPATHQIRRNMFCGICGFKFHFVVSQHGQRGLGSAKWTSNRSKGDDDFCGCGGAPAADCIHLREMGSTEGSRNHLGLEQCPRSNLWSAPKKGENHVNVHYSCNTKPKSGYVFSLECDRNILIHISARSNSFPKVLSQHISGKAKNKNKGSK